MNNVSSEFFSNENKAVVVCAVGSTPTRYFDGFRMSLLDMLKGSWFANWSASLFKGSPCVLILLQHFLFGDWAQENAETRFGKKQLKAIISWRCT